MLWVVVLLQVLMLLLLVVLLWRRPAAPPAAVEDRLLRLPESISALAARAEATEAGLRNGVEGLRRESAEAAAQGRRDADQAGRALRDEIATSIAALSHNLHAGLTGFRTDNGASAEQLRTVVHAELQAISDRLTAFFADAGKANLESRDALHTRLTDLGQKNTAGHETLRDTLQRRLFDLGEAQHGHQERLRLSMEERLTKLNADNSAKLEEMRVTVDEKLQTTLNERLTASFGQVTTHLGDVQKGLGEMKELASGVSDLKKVFSNVKARGIVGEFQLGMQLEQMFSREQYEKNVRIKPGSLESVEYALKVPQTNGNRLFPIDSKFPREDWERLEQAYEHGGAEDIAKAGAAFERAIRAEGKTICEKYIHEPVTLPHAIMFLPTEGLYAEVMRRPGLQSDLQQKCNVTIAGPSTLMAILTSFRMGFHSIALEKKGDEVWKVLGSVKSDFGKFADLMAKVEKQVGTVQNTLGDIAGKTKTINRNLRGITELPAGETASPLAAFDELANGTPLLTALSED